jgi:hypothetical protein
MLQVRVSARSAIFLDSLSIWEDRRPAPGGSMGLVVRDLDPRQGDADDRLILTASHVCGALSQAGPGEHRVLHSAIGPSQEQGRPLGLVRRSAPAGWQNDLEIDAAVIKPLPTVEVDTGVGLSRRAPTGVRDLVSEAPDADVPVFKFGASTGPTRGFLDPVPADMRTAAGVRYRSGWWIVGEDGDFAREGDSGAVVVDRENRVIGILTAIDQPSGHGPVLAFCLPIVPALDALKVTMP